MGGRSSGAASPHGGAGVTLSGTLNTNGGGFVYARARFDSPVDASGYAGVLVTASALPAGSQPLTLSLYLADGSQSWEFAAPFDVPVGAADSQGEKVTAFVPFDTMEGRVWWRQGPCSTCSLDTSRITEAKVYLLYQPGDFAVSIDDMTLLQSADMAPERTVIAHEFATADAAKDVLHGAISVGAPLYNAGYHAECAAHYAAAMRVLIDSGSTTQWAKETLQSGIDGATNAQSHSSAAWALRYAMDAVLESSEVVLASMMQSSAPSPPPPPMPSSGAGAWTGDDHWDPEPLDIEHGDVHVEAYNAIVAAIHEGAPGGTAATARAARRCTERPCRCC